MRFMHSLLFAALVLPVCCSAQTAAAPTRVDALVASNGVLRVALPTTVPASTKPALAARGVLRDEDGATRATVWMIDNPDGVARTVELQSRRTDFSLALTLAARERIVLRSPDTSAMAEHRLKGSGITSSWIAGVRTDFVDATLLPHVGNTNSAPRWHSANALRLVVGNQAAFFWPLAEDANNDPVAVQWTAGLAQVRAGKLPNSWLVAPTSTPASTTPARVRTSDLLGASSDTDIALRTLSGSCPLMPIAIPDGVVSTLAPGQVVTQMPRDSGNGNWSWLSWTGANSAPAMALSLRLPGDSERYVDPDDANDRNVDADDWVKGAPGNMNSDDVRAAMEGLLGRDIRVPVWKARRGQGSRFDVQVARFATISLNSYQLNGQGSLGFTYLGETECDNHAPVAVAATVSTEQDVALPIALSGNDLDGDALGFRVLNAPQHGTLSGTAPVLVYAPNAGYVGADSFSFVANDGEFDSEPAMIAITVTPKVITNHAPDAISAARTLNEDGSASLVLQGTDVDGNALSYVIDQLPEHGTITGTAPNLVYQPEANFNGEDRLRFHVNDGTLNSDVATITLTVAPVNDAPSADAQQRSVDEDTALDLFLTGQDIDGDSLTAIVDQQPAHGTLSGSAPNLTYTPAAHFNGTDTVRFHVNDGSANSSVTTIGITVAPVNDAPTAQTQSLSGNEGQPLTIMLAGSDIDGDTLSYVIDASPQHGSLGGGAPTLTYMPAPGFFGDDSLVFHVSDGNASSAHVTVTIQIAEVNVAPVAHSASVVVAEDGTIAFELTASDADGDSLSFIIDSQPAHGSLSGDAPALIYLPDADYFGSDSFSFHVSDGRLDSAVVTISLAVTAINDAPYFTSVPPTDVVAGSAYVYAAMADDVEADALTFALLDAPAGASIDAQGVVHYTPTAAHVGVQTLQIEVRDAQGASSTQTVSINVSARPNREPSFTGTPPTQATRGEIYHAQVIATDPDGDVLAFNLDEAPAGMEIDAANGTIAWTPADDQVGVHAVAVRVDDGRGGQATLPFQITVIAVNRAPVITSLAPTTATTGSAYSYPVLASDPDGDAIQYHLLAAPQGMQISATGVISWTPVDTQLAAFDVRVEVVDAEGASAVQDFRIIVNASLVGHSHVGREFHFAHGLNFDISNILGTPVDSPDRSHIVTVAAVDGATGALDIAGLGFHRDIAITGAGVQTIELPRAVMNADHGVARDLAVKVVVDRPVTVVSLNRMKNTTDAAVIYPRDVLGRDYTIADYHGYMSSNGGQMFVVATDHPARVTFIPPREGALPSGPNGQQSREPWSIDLLPGQTYQLTTANGGAPYSGMRVHANEDIAVFGGSPCANVPRSIGACDHLFEQLLPDRNLGQNFLAPTLATRTVGNQYKFTALHDDTVVTANGVIIAVIDEGESTERRVDGPVELHTSKPAQVQLLALGNLADIGHRSVPPDITTDDAADLMDPFSVALAPRETYLSDYLFTTPQFAQFRLHYAGVVIPDSALPSLRLDGQPVDVSGAPAIGASGYSQLNLRIAAGQHRLVAEAPFGLIAYGFGSYESYGYQGGLSLGDQSRIATLTVTPLSQRRTVSDAACFELVALDEAAHRVPYARFLVRVEGVRAQVDAGYFDGAGRGEYCYTQARTGVDQVLFQSGNGQRAAQVVWEVPDDGINRAPMFVSLPQVVLHEPAFAYDLVAVDPDGDVVQFSLSTAPAGATLSGGTISYAPPPSADLRPSTHRFVVIADDGRGGIAEQQFDLVVTFPPKILPRTLQDVTEGNYLSAVFDVWGGDELTIDSRWAQAPAGASQRLDASMPLIFEIPAEQDARAGRHKLQIDWLASSPLPTQSTMPLMVNPAAPDHDLSLALDERWRVSDLPMQRAVFGRLSDDNGDGVVDRRDRLVMVGVGLANGAYRVVTRHVDTGAPLLPPSADGAAPDVVPAIADLDGDAHNEIVFARWNGGPQLAVLNADGSLRWARNDWATLTAFTSTVTNIEVVDLDGNGTNEIVVGGRVYTAAGQPLWQFDAPSGVVSAGVLTSAIADLDGDGQLEVMFADQVRRADGSLVFRLSGDGGTEAPSALWAAADSDGDGQREIVASATQGTRPWLRAFRADGSALFAPVALNGHGGVPVLVDADGDGVTDILLPTRGARLGFDGRFHQADPSGASANLRGLVFDANGDGRFEQGTSPIGALMLKDALSGFVWSQSWGVSNEQSNLGVGYHALIDADGDGDGEIVSFGPVSTVLFEPSSGHFPAPVADPASFTALDRIDASRSGVATVSATRPNRIADAWIGNLRIAADEGDRIDLSVDVSNRGTAAIMAPLQVRLRQGEGGPVLGERVVAKLPMGRVVTLAFNDIDVDGLSGWIVAELASSEPDARTHNDRTASHLFDLRVSDGPHSSREDRTRWMQQVLAKPTRMQYTLSTPAQVGVNSTWEGRVVPVNAVPDGAYYFERVAAPRGFVVEPFSGRMHWVPSADQMGSRTVNLVMRSFDGGVSDPIQFSINVLASNNHAPQITSEGAGHGAVNLAYRYDVIASDPDGDALSYTLTSAPDGMTIAADGRIDWLPTVTGLYSFTVRVSDALNATASQTVSLRIDATLNHAPQWTSTPWLVARVGEVWSYRPTATDADGDAVSYTTTTGPMYMGYDPVYRISGWVPRPEQVGLHAVTMLATDFKDPTPQSFTIRVLPATSIFAATLSATPEFAQVGDNVSIAVTDQYALGPVTHALTLNGQAIALDADGRATFAATSAGSYRFDLVSSDGSSTVTNAAIVHVGTIGDTGAPLVQLLAPDADSEVTSPTTVLATIDDADLARWQLFLATGESDPAPRLIATGDANVAAAAITTLDPTMLINGYYQLILTATDRGGRSSSDRRALRIDGDLKLGHFSLSFLEAEVPLMGIPIRITRTYDTRQSHEHLDFGHGWSIDYQNVRVRENRRPGFAWSQTQEGGPFGQWCVRSNGAREVTVTLPDGDVETFRAKFNPECSGLTANVVGTLLFEPVGDTQSTLEQTDYGTVQLINTGAGPNLADPGNPSVPVDPQHYQLKTAEGIVYVLDQDFGIRMIADQHENTLSFSREGILHSSGVSIPFTRDSAGRITRIALPDGQTLRYAYNANGDLIESRDQLGNATTVSYLTNPRYPHWLEEIRDPLGRRAIRNEYDASGRLVKTIDANGQAQEFTHALATHTTSVKNRLGRTTTYGFDDDGNIVSETNPLNETTLRSYDGDGNELTVTDPLGRTTTRTYDTRGNVLTETNDLGETTTRTYNAANQLLTETDHAGRVVARNTYWVNQAAQDTAVLLSTQDALDQVTTFDIDTFGDGSLRALEDANGAVTSFVYDGHGNVILETDAEGHVTQRTYDTMGRVLTESQTRVRDHQPETLTTTHRYDAKGQLVETIAANGDVSRRTYDANGRVTVETVATGAAARSTYYEYDTLGRLWRTTYPDHTFETTTYDAEGNEIGKRDRAGNVTTMVYDAANRLIETIHPDDTPGTNADNPRTRNDYDAAGQLIATWDELDRPTEYVYDDAGRQIEVIDALGHSNRSVYDDTGRRTASIDALNRQTRYVYDAAGRMTGTVLPDADADDGDDANNPRITMAYDATGRKIAETDPGGRTTHFAYDDRGQLIEVIQPGDLSTTYSYDEQGRKLTQTDAEGRTTRWSYDKLGRVLTRTLPMGQSEHHVYDGYGNLAAKTDFNGQTTTYTYDTLSRPTRTDYADSRTEHVVYDALGRRTQVTTPDGVWTFAYDAHGRVIEETQPGGITLRYQYDPAGNRTRFDEISASGTSTIVYQYDALNRMISAQQDALPAITYAYNALGLRISEVQGALTTTYTHNRQNQLTRIETKRGSEFVRSLEYVLDTSGLRIAQIEREVIDGITTDRRIDYTYDELKRLTSEVERDGNTNVVRSGTWTYDDVGNRLTQVTTDGLAPAAKTATTTYTYDSNDRLLTEATNTVDAGNATTANTTHRYDLNGSLLESTTTDGSTRYRYNSDQRLIEVRKPNNELFQFAYDPDDLRISRTAAGIKTTFAVDRNLAYGEVVSEREQSGALKARYLHTDQLAQQITLDNGVSNLGYPLRDGIGSTRYLANPTGTVTDALRYTAWGESVARLGTTSIANSYAGEYVENDLGLSFNRARWYRPVSGHFVAQDPFAGEATIPSSHHDYAYVANDPVDEVDPTGLTNLQEQNQVGSSIGSMATRTVQSFRHLTNRALTYATRTARAARELARNCLRAKRSCPLTVPILVVGTNFPNAAQHIEDSQRGAGSNVVGADILLTYVRRSGKPSWYSRMSECTGIARAKAIRDFGPLIQCDEFPFYAARQGGPENYPHRVSLRLIPMIENRGVGVLLAGMVSASKMRNNDHFIIITDPSVAISFFIPFRKR